MFNLRTLYLVCEIPRSFKRSSLSNFRTQGSFIHINSGKILERDLVSSDSVANSVLPIHKKESRQLKKNYRPISLLSICGKIFEKLIVDVMYEFLNKLNLWTPKQSGFRSWDSTINQLLSITNEIHKAFDEYPSRETRAIFLDISKAFDNVWHEGLIFKLKSNGVFQANFLISSKAFYLSVI